MQDLFDAVCNHWYWAIPRPTAIIAANKFGHVLVLAKDQSVWHLCPEQLACTCVAVDHAAGRSLLATPTFRDSWQMTEICALAEASLGVLTAGHCFSLKTPACSGGKYQASNMGTTSLLKLIEFAGDLAQRVRRLPGSMPESF